MELEIISITQRPRISVGSCMFCTRPHKVVIVCTGSTNFILRACKQCFKEIRNRTK